MWKFVTDKKEILKYHNLFRKNLDAIPHKKIPVVIGFKGKTKGKNPEATVVKYSKELNLWWRFDDNQTGNRYWNPFGKGEPEKNKNIAIIFEINYAREFRNYKVDRGIAAAGFVKNQHGDIMLVHSGRIGGGREGIGKTLFLNNYRGKWIEVDIGGQSFEYVPIALLNSPKLAQHVNTFVMEVDRIKRIAKQPYIQTPPRKRSNDFSFNNEFTGKKKLQSTKPVIAECDHGLLVNTLSKLLSNEGYLVGNDRNRDLFIYNRSKITHLFEFKTSIDSQSIYTAIGQLFLNSIDSQTKNLFLVVPKGLTINDKTKMKKIGISVLEYSWKKNKEPIFIDWKKILKCRT